MEGRPRSVPALGEILLKDGAITRELLDDALERRKRTGLKLDEVLVSRGYVTESRIAAALARSLGLPLLTFGDMRPTAEALSLVPEGVAARLCVMPLFVTPDGGIAVATADPLDMEAADELRLLTGREPSPKVAARGDIERAAVAHYRVRGSADAAAADGGARDAALEKPGSIEAEAGSAPVARLVNSLLEQAARERASDIHIEPLEDGTRVRFRIDGRLSHGADIPPALHPALAARVKILAGMDISEKRRPQDGRILFRSAGNCIDVRVSSLPSIFGEKIVMRLLRRGGGAAGLEDLGFGERERRALREAISSPNGIVLLTGPTGSGKSTTLYSLLSMLNEPSKNIVTIEDPVEYTIKGVTQMQINEKIGLTFGGALRSILRQDPDVIMIGEIRDSETAHLAVRAALTGHLVLSTLHTNDAPSSVGRLVDMGVPPFLLASSLRAVAAQRLVRKLCPSCRKRADARGAAAELGLSAVGAWVYEPAGCPECRFTGYSGRTVVAEIMPVGSGLRRMIYDGASSDELRREARRFGMETLREAALRKTLAGETSLEETLFATQAE
ncbi:GspE/PulE family protein [Cloacibacillus sp. An23]|uniref:GspE/PulE family protein n=1 Tax=Cloacibacillus sp. An23 TaxID=1965591 RepID=UPI000B387CA4|nr:GspE/PulE family protein [Cloacibacillus sp. An23]OUO92685.1 type II secretion system protein GspE [Cloacibacillus sp. An23]